MQRPDSHPPSADVDIASACIVESSTREQHPDVATAPSTAVPLRRESSSLPAPTCFFDHTCFQVPGPKVYSNGVIAVSNLRRESSELPIPTAFFRSDGAV
jgi:hypothetical protein